MRGRCKPFDQSRLLKALSHARIGLSKRRMLPLAGARSLAGYQTDPNLQAAHSDCACLASGADLTVSLGLCALQQLRSTVFRTAVTIVQSFEGRKPELAVG